MAYAEELQRDENNMDRILRLYRQVESSTSMLVPTISDYVSVVNVSGQPILPPLMTDDKRREMQRCRNEAVLFETRRKTKTRQKLLEKVQLIMDEIEERYTPPIHADKRPDPVAPPDENYKTDIPIPLVDTTVECPPGFVAALIHSAEHTPDSGISSRNPAMLNICDEATLDTMADVTDISTDCEGVLWEDGMLVGDLKQLHIGEVPHPLVATVDCLGLQLQAGQKSSRSSSVSASSEGMSQTVIAKGAENMNTDVLGSTPAKDDNRLLDKVALVADYSPEEGDMIRVKRKDLVSVVPPEPSTDVAMEGTPASTEFDSCCHVDSPEDSSFVETSALRTESTELAPYMVEVTLDSSSLTTLPHLDVSSTTANHRTHLRRSSYTLEAPSPALLNAQKKAEVHRTSSVDDLRLSGTPRQLDYSDDEATTQGEAAAISKLSPVNPSQLSPGGSETADTSGLPMPSEIAGKKTEELSDKETLLCPLENVTDSSDEAICPSNSPHATGAIINPSNSLNQDPDCNKLPVSTNSTPPSAKDDITKFPAESILPNEPICQSAVEPISQFPKKPVLHSPKKHVYYHPKETFYHSPREPVSHSPKEPAYESPENPSHASSRNPIDKNSPALSPEDPIKHSPGIPSHESSGIHDDQSPKGHANQSPGIPDHQSPGEVLPRSSPMQSSSEVLTRVMCPAAHSERHGKEEHLQRYLQQLSEMPAAAAAGGAGGDDGSAYNSDSDKNTGHRQWTRSHEFDAASLLSELTSEELAELQAAHFERRRLQLLEQQRQQLQQLLAEQQRQQLLFQQQIAAQEQSGILEDSSMLSAADTSPAWRPVSVPAPQDCTSRTPLSGIHRSPAGQKSHVRRSPQRFCPPKSSTPHRKVYYSSSPPPVHSHRQSAKQNESPEITPSLQSKLEKLSAAVKGYLTRRLLRTDKVQHLILTIKDTAVLLIGFQQELPGKQKTSSEDNSLYDRAVTQLTSSIHEINRIFVEMSPQERMCIIAQSRLAEQERHFKAMEAYDKSSAKKKRCVSQATMKAMARREKAQAAQVSLVDGELRPFSAPPMHLSKLGSPRRGRTSLDHRALRTLHMNNRSRVAKEKANKTLPVFNQLSPGVTVRRKVHSRLTRCSNTKPGVPIATATLRTKPEGGAVARITAKSVQQKAGDVPETTVTIKRTTAPAKKHPKIVLQPIGHASGIVVKPKVKPVK